MVPASRTEKATMLVLKDFMFFFFTALVADFESAGFGNTPTLTVSINRMIFFNQGMLLLGSNHFLITVSPAISRTRKKTARKVRFILKLTWCNNYYCEAVIP